MMAEMEQLSCADLLSDAFDADAAERGHGTNIASHSEPNFKVGDDGSVDISDITLLVDFLFVGGPTPDPYEAADIDHDGMVNIIDLCAMVDLLFL